MSWKVSKRKYDQIMILGKVSVPTFVITRVLIEYTTSGALGFWLALVALVSVPAIGFSGLVWLWGKTFGIEQKSSTSPSESAGGRGSSAPRTDHATDTAGQQSTGGDIGYLQYQCEGCGTVLEDWQINEFGSEYTCGECGYALDNQRAAADKVDEGWAWDEDEGFT